MVTSKYSNVPTDDNGIEMRSYTDNPSDDDEAEANNESPDQESTPALPRNRRREYPGSAGSSMDFVIVVWTGLFAVLMICLLVLLRWRSVSMAKSHEAARHYESTIEPIPTVLTPTSAPVATQPLLPVKDSTPQNSIQYNPSVFLRVWDPFNLTTGMEMDNPLSPPSLPWQSNETEGLGFLILPDIVDNSVVFIAEGDLYWTRIKPNMTITESLPAVKLTTTVGNVRDPKINPLHPNLIAYTATYSGHREIYLLDLLKPSQPAQRLTYWQGSSGIVKIAGWKNDGSTLVFSAQSLRSNALPDLRIFQVDLQQDGSGRSMALQINAVPLSQALDGAFHKQNSSSNSECVYFTRFRQTSHTVRYVGGTAESLWAYCEGKDLAIPITADYNGTSKDPAIMELDGNSYLLFLSDRSPSGSSWRPSTMNLWAILLPTETDLYGSKPSVKSPVQLTRISCDFQGKALQEYAFDSKTGAVILRIGADLHILSAAHIRDAIESQKTTTPSRLSIQVLSDFHEQQERLIPVTLPDMLVGADVFEASHGTTNMLLAIRGQVWVVPVVRKPNPPFQGAGQNIPERRYRVLPGPMTGGSIRVLNALYVPMYEDSESDVNTSESRTPLALVLATDPLSSTAEHAFYLIKIGAAAFNAFSDLAYLPIPFVGGHINGGSVKDGGLGSVDESSLVLSECGRRLAWTDKDGRICVMNLPIYNSDSTTYSVLPKTNELGEPLNGNGANLLWSPGGRYLAIRHGARNQMDIITIADCGIPPDGNATNASSVNIGRLVQATPSRFNVRGMYWGTTAVDKFLSAYLKKVSVLLRTTPPDDVVTTLYFLSDRDVITDIQSPWGPRAPQPHFPLSYSVYALPLIHKTSGTDERILPPIGRYPGGAAQEIFFDELNLIDQKIRAMAKAKAGNNTENDQRLLNEQSSSLRRALKDGKVNRQHITVINRFLDESATNEAEKSQATESNNDTDQKSTTSSRFPSDPDLDFGTVDLAFARTAYRLSRIPKGKYTSIISQTRDDGSLLITEKGEAGLTLHLFSTEPFPSDYVKKISLPYQVAVIGESTTRDHIYLVAAGGNAFRVLTNAVASLTSEDVSTNFADTKDMAISVWPALEYSQMYNDAWRMLRDYFYDTNLHNIDWPAVHERYKPLVKRCAKREDLDDVLGQMASELSALHVFVRGGEYNAPFANDNPSVSANAIASLGAELQRAPEWKGYTITDLPDSDPDFSLKDGIAIYSPLSDRALSISGQKGLQVGDVIIGVNGESVMSVPDIHMLLRGMAGHSVRLEVLRLKSGEHEESVDKKNSEPLIAVPITADAAATVRYDAWVWKTRRAAQDLATKAGFSVGYIHLRDMTRNGADAFARDYYPDYDKDALILDVRHNGGGNIDSWILTVLQKRAWMFWGDRTGSRNGDLDWDEQFAFRGHVVVLIDEHTASDAEGVSRGISELKLGTLIGTRTWGGGIWLSSDNILVDGGIASAPEIGTFNARFGWGLGIEQHGVVPDIIVDNNPRLAYDGVDTQLVRAIAELKKQLDKEPIEKIEPPPSKPDMSFSMDDCPA